MYEAKLLVTNGGGSSFGKYPQASSYSKFGKSGSDGNLTGSLRFGNYYKFECKRQPYSCTTAFTRFRGLSTSIPRSTALK